MVGFRMNFGAALLASIRDDNQPFVFDDAFAFDESSAHFVMIDVMHAFWKAIGERQRPDRGQASQCCECA